MSPQLRAMIFGVGAFLLGGVGFYVYTPVPSTRTMAELKDAGITLGQRFVLTCPERLTAQTIRRINAVQPGLLRPSQSYAHVARTAVCFNPDAGNCFRPSDGLLRVADLQGEIVVPSLRRDLSGVDLDAGLGSDTDGGEDGVDDSFQYATTSCTVTTCPNYDAGDGSNFCGRLNRLMAVQSPCMVPNGWKGADGGWDETGEVDCRFLGPWTLDDGGARWVGYNVLPAQYAVGTACVPVECSVVAGDAPEQWL